MTKWLVRLFTKRLDMLDYSMECDTPTEIYNLLCTAPKEYYDFQIFKIRNKKHET